jgi:hypothetical protein
MCDDTTIHKISIRLSNVFACLMKSFAYLNSYYPNDIEKEAVKALSQYWRKLGLGITLKAHYMLHHVCSFNGKHGIGDKEESYVEQGHQVDARENS